MAKNFKSAGNTVTFTAPAGGVVGGVPVVLGSLVVIPAENAAEGTPAVGFIGGCWYLPAAAGLTLGAKVGLLDHQLVAADTANAVPFGKLLSDSVGGYADALLVA